MARQPLTRARIVAAAIKTAARHGLSAVTLRGLAGRLGVHVTSLYNHVATKEAVLDGVVEQLVAEADLPTGVVAWEDWVRRFAVGLRAVARQHPGAVEALHQRPIQGAQAAESAEAALAAFRAAGFDAIAAYHAVKATTSAVLGLLLEEVASLRTPGLSTDLSVLPAARFPKIHEAGEIVAKADPWTYLIDVLVDGLTSSLARSRLRSSGAAE